MKQLTREWLNSAEDDLITIENLLDNPILTNKEAEMYFQEALKIKKQAEAFLLEHTAES